MHACQEKRNKPQCMQGSLSLSRLLPQCKKGLSTDSISAKLTSIRRLQA